MDSVYTCLAVISLDSVLNKDGKYYRQVFMIECKHIWKEIIRHINDNSSNFSSGDDSDEE